MLETLQAIGQALLAELGGGRHRREVLGTGAAGDKTYPVDRRAEEIIVEGLRIYGEPMTVVSEEAGEVPLNGGGGTTVLIDPIDGSNNAVTGVPVYATSIAVARGGRTLGDVEMAYIVNLISGEEFWAQRGGGAFCDGERIAAQSDDALRAVSYETRTPAHDLPRALPLLAQATRTRCLGAVALELAYLASGAFSAFVSPSPSRSFDFAAGWLIVREAGGVMTGLQGADLSPIGLSVTQGAALAASANEALHRRVLELLA